MKRVNGMAFEAAGLMAEAQSAQERVRLALEAQAKAAEEAAAAQKAADELKASWKPFPGLFGHFIKYFICFWHLLACFGHVDVVFLRFFCPKKVGRVQAKATDSYTLPWQKPA